MLVRLPAVSRRIRSWLVTAFLAAATVRCHHDRHNPVEATPPAAPSGLAAVIGSASQINLTWTDNAGDEAGYWVERAPGGTVSFVEIATLGPNVSAYQNTGLAAATSYSYRVRAHNNVGASAYSNTATAATAAPSPPASPSSLSAAAVSESQINLSWADNSVNEDGFRIERAPGGTTSFAEIASVGPGVVAYQNTGLAASTAYSYRVRAYNGVGNSAYSNTASAATQAAPPPAAPTSLSATQVSSSQVNLAWTDNATNESGFRIERAPGGTTTFTEIETVGVGVTTYQNTGLAAATAYSYRVRAYNGAGNSAYSNVASATTPSAPVPAAPTNLTATAISSSQINLGWTDNATNETGFRVEECVGASCTNFIELGTVGANATSEPITGTTGGTTYRYRIRAYNGAGNSAYSNIASATTPNSQVEQTFVASFDNLLMFNSRDATVGNTVYQGAENAVGYNYYYDFQGYLFGYIGAASALKFNVQPTISGKTILEAKLILYEYYLPGDMQGTFRLAAIASSWSASTITWNSWTSGMSYYTSITRDFAALASSAVPIELDVTAIVQNWANGTFANNGFQIWDPNPALPGYESYQALGIESLEQWTATGRRPRLYIRYQ